MAAQEMNAASIAASLRNVTPKLEGDRAAFPDLLTLQKIDGAWRVVELAGHQQDRAELARLLTASINVYNGLSDDLEKEKFASYAQMEMAASERFREAFAAAASRPATQPGK